MNHRTRIIFLVFWITTIFLLTGYPSISLPPIKGFPFDKIAHAVIFLIMGLIQRPLLRFRSYCLLGLAVVLVAEFQQLFIPGRTFELGDILAGLVGIAIPLAIIRRNRSSVQIKENKRRTHNDLPET